MFDRVLKTPGHIAIIVEIIVIYQKLLILNKLWYYFKSVRIRSFLDLYFSLFGLNAERYGVSLHIQSECAKIRTKKTSNTDTFHAVWWCQEKVVEQVTRFISVLKLLKLRHSWTMCLYYREDIAGFWKRGPKKFLISRSLENSYLEKI